MDISPILLEVIICVFNVLVVARPVKHKLLLVLPAVQDFYKVQLVDLHAHKELGVTLHQKCAKNVKLLVKLAQAHLILNVLCVMIIITLIL